MREELFPQNFPPELAAAAFISGNEEMAWRPTFAAAAVDWLGGHGYAVLGTELWLLQDGRINSLPVGLSGMGEVHGNAVNRENAEAWNSYVSRAAAETLAYLQSFNPTDIVEEGDLHFNVVWVSKADFQKLGS